MLSAANQSLAMRDPALRGLRILLDEQATAQALAERGLDVAGTTHIEYLRYKPQLRCISVVRWQNGSQDRRFVLTAFPESVYERHRAKTANNAFPPHCWHDDVNRIRIDQFPFDPGLRHIAKCFEPASRNRLLRRTLGWKSHPDQFTMDSLAYKPGRRYVASASDNTVKYTTPAQPSFTFKFYADSPFAATLQRLQSVNSIDICSPQVVGFNEHYRAIALEWVRGQLFAEDLSQERLADTELFEIGCQLARLHNCCLPTQLVPAVAPHELEELAEYIGFLSPQLGRLASQLATETQFHLASMKSPSTMIHGDFYAKQVLVDQGRIEFIDFDQAGVGSPYQDVGNFVAKLYWQAINQGLAQAYVEQCADIFLHGYRNNVNGFDERAYGAQLAASLIRCATHPFRRAMQAWEETTLQILKLAHCSLHSSDLLIHSSQLDFTKI